MRGCSVLAPILIALLIGAVGAAPTGRSFGAFSGETRGLEVPEDLVAGIGLGRSSMQLVVNIHTDNHGNIEVQTN